MNLRKRGEVFLEPLNNHVWEVQVQKPRDLCRTKRIQKNPDDEAAEITVNILSSFC